MLVPAVGVRKLLNCWRLLGSLEDLGVRLGGAVAFIRVVSGCSPDVQICFAGSVGNGCNQRCACARWKYSLGGVLSRLINTDQFILIRRIPGEQDGLIEKA